MRESVGYSSMPGLAGRSGQAGGAVLVINGTPVPAVPTGSCLLLLVGLVIWSVGMLQARSTVDGIFSDLALEAESLNQLKAMVLASVVVLALLVLAALVANVWLEAGRLTGTGNSDTAAGTIQSLQAYSSHCFRINVANWALLLLAALALAGSITWLTTMSTALSATQQGGGYGHTALPPTTATLGPEAAAAAAAAAATAAAALPDVGQVWTVRACPPGCIDLGLIAEVLGLPWPCFCQVWLLGDLVEQLQKVVAQLWVAVVGAVLLFVALSWLYGYLAAQGAHAAHDLQQAVAQESEPLAGADSL